MFSAVGPVSLIEPMPRFTYGTPAVVPTVPTVKLLLGFVMEPVKSTTPFVRVVPPV